MLRIKITELNERNGVKSIRKLSEDTGIRWNTLSDMDKGTAKHWPPEHLEKLMEYYKLEEIGQLIEYKKETTEE